MKSSQLDLFIIISIIFLTQKSLVWSSKLGLLKYPTDVYALPSTEVTFECSPNQEGSHILWEFIPPGIRLPTNMLATIQHNKGAQINEAFQQYKEYSVEPNGRLTIHNLQYRNDGVYVCRVLKGLNDAKANATLTVLRPPDKAEISYKTDLKEATSVEFNCSSSNGNPPPSFQWYLKYPGGRISNQSNLATNFPPQTTYGTSISRLITSLTPRENGATLQCIVRNRVNQTSTTKLLDIKYTPRIKSFEFNPYFVQETKRLEYRCEAHGNPSPRILWTDARGQIVQYNAYLVLPNIQRNQRGVYTCAAENIVGIVKQNLTIDVQYPPQVTVPTEINVPVGSKVLLSCSVDSNPAPNNISWSTPNDHHCRHCYGAKMEIPSVTRQYQGEYKCVAKNIMKPSNKTWLLGHSFNVTKLIVQYSPGKPLIEPEEIVKEYKVGDTIRINCLENIEDPGIPKPNFEWIALTSNQIVSHKPSLVILRAEIVHNGRYMCIPYNSIGRGPGTDVKIIVNEAPVFVHNLSSYTSSLRLGQSNFKVNCSVRSKPAAIISWLRNSNLLFPNGTLDFSGEMFSVKSREVHLTQGEWLVTSELQWLGSKRTGRDRLEPADNARFTCVAGNRLGRISSHLNLQVTFVPQFTSTVRKVATMIGAGVARIVCEVDAVPKPTLHWYLGTIMLPDKGSQKYQVLYKHIDGYSYSLDLIINGVRKQDLRDYTCIAFNDMNNGQHVETKYFLTEHSVPEPPKNIFIRSYTWESAEIMWTPGFDGGYSQKFYIVYSNRGVTKNTEVDNNIGVYNLTGLHPSRNYTICIYAKNQLGNSNCSKQIYYFSQGINIPRVTDVVVDEDGKTISFKSPPGVYCHRVESSHDDGFSWSIFRDCIDPKASNIKISLPRMRKETVYRISTCLVSRRDVCSPPVSAWMESQLPEIPISVILIVALVCLVIIILLALVLLFFCCRRKRSPKAYDTPANSLPPCANGSCFTDSVYTCPPTSPIHLAHSNNNSQTLHSSHSNGQIVKPFTRVPPSSSSQLLHSSAHYTELPTSETTFLMSSPSPASSVLYSIQRHPSSNGDCAFNQEAMKTSFRQSMIESSKSDEMQEPKVVYQTPCAPPSDSGYQDGSNQSFSSGTQEAFVMRTFGHAITRQPVPPLPLRGTMRTQSYAV